MDHASDFYESLEQTIIRTERRKEDNMAASSLLMKFVLLGLLSTVVAGGAHCIGNLNIDEFDAFMLNATRTSDAQSAFVEVSEGAETTKIGFERNAPANGVTVLELCVNIEIPVGPVKAQVVLDGFLTSAEGPLIHGIEGTAKVAAVMGFGWLGEGKSVTRCY